MRSKLQIWGHLGRIGSSRGVEIFEGLKDLYNRNFFNSNFLIFRQHAITAVKSLSDLVLKLNPSQLDALEEVVREWVKSDVLDKNCIQVLFERFSKKIPGTSEKHSWAALVLIRMVAA